MSLASVRHVPGLGYQSPAADYRPAFPAGPRAWTFQHGERRAALDAILTVSDVVLMTQEEATAVTGAVGAEQAARHILTRPGTRTEWCIVKQGAEGALLASRSRGDVHQQVRW